MMGNTMIIKPAPTTPLTSLKLGELTKDRLPPGVLNILADDNDLGQAITAHPGIAKVSFTGSTPTGKSVTTSPMLKRMAVLLPVATSRTVQDSLCR